MFLVEQDEQSDHMDLRLQDMHDMHFCFFSPNFFKAMNLLIEKIIDNGHNGSRDLGQNRLKQSEAVIFDHLYVIRIMLWG